MAAEILIGDMSDHTEKQTSPEADGRDRRSEELLPLLYQELRRLAASLLARELPGQTLQATALVHEAWLRVQGDTSQRWESRRHFLAAAAEAMRRILVEILGPFANEQGAGYPHAFIPEDKTTVDRNAVYATSLGPLRWKNRTDGQDDGVIYLGAIFPSLEWATAYLSTTIESDGDQQAELRLGSDDGAKVGVNGKLAFLVTGPRTLALDHDTVPVELRHGPNQLLVKVCNERGEWNLSVRLTAPGGKPLLRAKL
jgi:hypothetical protein